MRIDWFTVRETAKEIEQKADVTNNTGFWNALAYAKRKSELARKMNCAPPDTLDRYVSLSREVIGGKSHWFAYRKVSKSDQSKLRPYRCSYRLQSKEGLLPYQPRAVQALCNAIVSHGCAADASDTGLGKTYVSLAVCRELKVSPGIVCKIAGLDTWKDVCASFGIVPQFIVNWEHAKGKKFRYVIRQQNEYKRGYNYRWNIPKNTLLIFDEAHLANNPGTHNYALHQAAKGIPSISISATFADKSAKMRGLTKLLGIFTEEEFSQWLQYRGYYETRENQYESISEIDNMKELNKIIFPEYGARLAYTDPDVKLFFPEAVIQTMIVSIGQKNTEKQNNLYGEMLSRVEDLKNAGKQAEALVAYLRYRQATELLKADTLVDTARELIYEGKSVLIFVNFRETLAYLAKALNTRSLIFGSQEKYAISRPQVIADFQANRTNIILLMMEAGGASISLHDIHGGHQRVSLICPTDTPTTLKQVLGRTRRGNTKTIPIMKMVYAAGTIEKKIAESVNAKIANISALNDGDMMESDLFNLGVNGEQVTEHLQGMQEDGEA